MKIFVREVESEVQADASSSIKLWEGATLIAR